MYGDNTDGTKTSKKPGLHCHSEIDKEEPDRRQRQRIRLCPREGRPRPPAHFGRVLGDRLGGLHRTLRSTPGPRSFPSAADTQNRWGLPQPRSARARLLEMSFRLKSHQMPACMSSFWDGLCYKSRDCARHVVDSRSPLCPFSFTHESVPLLLLGCMQRQPVRHLLPLRRRRRPRSRPRCGCRRRTRADVFQPRADPAEVAFVSEEEGPFRSLGLEPDSVREGRDGRGVTADETTAKVDPVEVVLLGVHVAVKGA